MKRRPGREAPAFALRQMSGREHAGRTRLREELIDKINHSIKTVNNIKIFYFFDLQNYNKSYIGQRKQSVQNSQFKEM